jgi:hypothetical protein
MSLAFVGRARADVGAEAGSSSEFLMVSSTIEGEDRSFTLTRPLGLHVGADWGDPGDSLRPLVFGQIQFPTSLSRIESLRTGLGVRHYLNAPTAAASGDQGPVALKTRTSPLYFVQVGLTYQRVFLAFLDKDNQAQSFGRSAAGFAFGGGADFFFEFLSSQRTDWRYADDRRMRLKVMLDGAVSLLTLDVATTKLTSVSLKIALQKPL